MLTDEEQKRLYDYRCKQIIAERYIQANILHFCVKEFQPLTIEKIALKCIEGDPAIATVPVASLSVPTKVSGLNPEIDTDEGNAATYDVVTQVLLPPFDMPMWMIVNFEAQNDAYPGYPIMKRGVFYGCSLITDQYGKVFVKSHFERIHRVCSIWIVTNPPKHQEYTINTYRIIEENTVGNYKDKEDNYNLLTIVVIRLGSKHHSELTGIFRLLNALFLDKMTPGDLAQLMKDEYSIIVTPELEKGVKEMCNLSEGVYRRGVEQGRKEMSNLSEGVYRRGIEHERDATVITMLKHNEDPQKIMLYTSVTPERLATLRASLA